MATDLAWLAAPIVAVKMAIEISAAGLLRGRSLAWRHAAAIPLKDLLYFTGWFASFAVRTVVWRGKPVFIRRRTADEIAAAQKDDVADLREPHVGDELHQGAGAEGDARVNDLGVTHADFLFVWLLELA